MTGEDIRPIARIIQGVPASDGAGVSLTRVIGTPTCDHVDPFLLLDEFRNENPDDYIAGFPSHPHRGFETVTYMMAGCMKHEDSAGNAGVLGPGDVQWMTAGRGIIHSEMPEQRDGLMWGYQLWVNLPAALKMSPPRYQDVPSDSIPEASDGPTTVRVIAGTRGDVSGAAETLTDVIYFDVTQESRTSFAHPLPDGFNACVYVIEGALSGRDMLGRACEIIPQQGAILGHTGAVSLEAGDDGARFLFIAGRAIGEPVARMGPFVMNTREELQQAVDDYRRGTLAR